MSLVRMLSCILRAWQQKKVTLEKLSKYNGKKEGVKNVLIHVSVRVEMKEGWDCAVSHVSSVGKSSQNETRKDRANPPSTSMG